MTTSRLPQITLACRNKHEFPTRAKAGATVRCPVCGAPKHVPAARPTTERAARQAESGPAPELPGAELAGRWSAEAEWSGELLPVSGRAGDECPECSGALQWEPGRTRVYCPACNRVELPAAVSAHYDRQASQRAEVAVQARPDRAAERAARTRLRALKEKAVENVDGWLDSIADDDCYDQAHWQREARDLAAMLRGYLPEIANAEDEAELTEVCREIAEHVTSDPGRALQSEYERAQQRAERTYRAQQESQREAARQRELAAQQEREQREADRQAAIAARSAPKALASGIRKADLNPYAQVGTMIALALEEKRANKEQKVAKYGPCGYTDQHRTPAVPTRQYWIMTTDWRGNDCGQLPDSPQVVVCKKHYQAADEWIEEQVQALGAMWGGCIRAVFTELS
jgi:hypothetical protein